jgi:NADH-quinone oxidoreductase subunit J
MEAALFYIFAAICLGGALLTVTRRNPVHCGVALIASLLGVAGLFLLQAAEFLFAVQILLYVGGVMVLFLFVVMLIDVGEAPRVRQYSRQWPVAAAALAAILVSMGAFLAAGFSHLPSKPLPRLNAPANTERVADVLFYQFALPFEAASLLLLVAIVGAVHLAKKKEESEP